MFSHQEKIKDAERMALAGVLFVIGFIVFYLTEALLIGRERLSLYTIYVFLLMSFILKARSEA